MMNTVKRRRNPVAGRAKPRYAVPYRTHDFGPELETTMSGSEAWAPALALGSIAFAFAVYYTAMAWFTHRERMAKIQRGIDPDQTGGGSNLQELADRVNLP